MTRTVFGKFWICCITFLFAFLQQLFSLKSFNLPFQCLLLLSYLIKNGSERVVSSARDHIYDMRQLEGYQHVDEYGKDQGLNSKFHFLYNLD